MARIANASCAVKDVKTAHSYLISKSHITAAADLDTQKLTDILFATSDLKNVSAEAVATIRAIAFIIDNLQPPEAHPEVEALENKVMKSMKTLTDTIITTFTDKLDEARKFLDATSVSQAETTMQISQTLTKCAALETTLTAATDKIHAIASTSAMPQEPRTWAQIAATPTNPPTSAPQYAFDPTEPAEITRLRQQLLLRTRMVMVEPCDAHEHSAADIRDQVNSWLKALDEEQEGETKPKTIIKAASPQPRGGLLLELDSTESAERFRTYMTTNPDLAKAFGPNATISEMTHRLVFKFIPCNSGFDPTNPLHLRELEESAGLNALSISSMSWCRPVEKRAPNQGFATAIVNVTSAKAANHLLHEHIYICDKRITILKDERQPLLCNKCQQYGHIRKNCVNETKCAACSGPHELTVCTNREHPACVSCGPDSNHSSNDRSCPAFQRRRGDLQKRFPEDSMPFFPMPNEPATWVRAPATAAPPQQPYNRPPRPPYPQNEHQHHDPNLGTGLFLRQQTMYNMANRARHRPADTPYSAPQRQGAGTNAPPPPRSPRPAHITTPTGAPLPSQMRDDSLDREIMDTNTITAGARAFGGLPPKPPATFEDSLPRTVSQ